jgi:hypothetical protein
MALPAIVAELKASTAEFNAKMDESKAKVKEFSDSGSSSVSKFSGILAGAALGGGAALAGFGVVAVDQADKLEVAQSKLKTAVENTGGSWDDYQKQISSASSNMENLGFTHAEFDDALSHAVASTQDTSKALGEMGLSADLARFKNIDLTTATDALDKAQTGNLRPLKQLGIDLPVAATSAEKLSVANDALTKAQGDLNMFLLANPTAIHSVGAAHDEYLKKLAAVQVATKKVGDESSTTGQIMSALGQRIGDTASNQADTFSGRIQAIQAHLEDFAASVGMWLIPRLEDIASWLGDWWTNNGPTVEGLIDKVAGGFEKFAQIVGSMVAPMLQYLEQHWDQVKIILMVIGAFIGGTLLVLLGSLAVGIGVIVVAVTGLITGLTLLVQGLQWLWDKTTGVRDALGGFATDVYNVGSQVIGTVGSIMSSILSIPGGISNGFGQVFDIFIGPFKAAFSAIAHMWNSTVGQLSFTLPSWVPFIGGDGFSMPLLPSFHQGGVVPGQFGQEVMIRALGGERYYMPGQTPPDGGGSVTIHVPVMVDGQQLASVTAHHNQAALLRLSRRDPSLGLT